MTRELIIPTGGTIAGLLRGRAEEQPDRIGYTFLDDGETDEVGMTYAETARRARAIATGIREAGGGPGARVLLLLPPGLDYVASFFGCTDAGVIAVPVYPPDPFQLDRTLPRLLSIVRDADPVIALTTSALLDYLDQVAAMAPELGALRWLAVDTLPDGDGGDVPVEPDAVAMLQYTSGSTATPKGVMLSHANLLHNLALIQRFFGVSPDTRALVWLPPYHDMGLIGGLLQPLYAGCPVTLMSPLHFLEQPMRWLRAIDRFGVTASGGPNFAYELLARKADPEEVARLDLSRWQVAFNGAEPIRPETMSRFAETFAPAGFRAGAFLPCYGLAEATLIVSGTGGGSRPPEPVRVDRDALERNRAVPAGDGPAVALTDCGPGADGQHIAVVDPATGEPCPPDRVGEIWVSGPSVARGYWRMPGESDRVFGARLGERRYLRTGDLGFLHDGRVVVTGRLKDLIIVRGRNHYPQDIERLAERADPVLRTGCATAFQVPGRDGEDEVAVVVEVRRGAEDADVAAVGVRVRQAVSEGAGLRVGTVTLIRAGGLPKTSSGKVQRRLCRERLLAGELPEIGRHEITADPGTPAPTGTAADILLDRPERRPALVERYLRTRISELTGIAAGDLDGAAPLPAAGLDSLAVVQLKHRLETDLGADLPLSRLMSGATLAEVAAEVAVLVGEPVTRPEEALGAAPGEETTAPMSHGQRWIWLVQLLEPDTTAYTITTALRLHGRVDRVALRRAFDAVVARHPALRTTFPVRDGHPVQVVHPAGPAAYAEHDLPEQDEEQLGAVLTAAARRPFDLESGPLLRADLFRHPGGEVLLLAMHHIVTDFWSSAILARELGAYYTAYASGRDLDLRPPRAGYLDVSAWRQHVHDNPRLSGPLERYWTEELGHELPRLALRAADPRHPGPGGVTSFALSSELAQGLRERAAAENVTMYVLLLAAFQSLLHQACGQDDLAVGAALAGRTRPEFADVVGCCTTTALIRGHAEPGDTFRNVLARTRERVIGALDHQDYPMTLVAERHRLSSRGSLVDVLFAYNRSPLPADDLAALVTVGPPGRRRSLGSLEVENVPLAPEPGALPLEVVVSEVDGIPYGHLRYAGGTLDEPAAERLVEQFVTVLEKVSADPETRLGDLLGVVARPA